MAIKQHITFYTNSTRIKTYTEVNDGVAINYIKYNKKGSVLKKKIGNYFITFKYNHNNEPVFMYKKTHNGYRWYKIIYIKNKIITINSDGWKNSYNKYQVHTNIIVNDWEEEIYRTWQ